MRNPFKIIHKFKNDNNRIQFLVYIFVGSLIDDEVVKILESIKDKDFYDTLIYINPKKRKIIETTYGEKWYTYFFINEHLTYSIKKINDDKKLQKKVIESQGKEWYQKNIELKNASVKNLFKKNIPFSFSTDFQNHLVARNKIKSVKLDEDETSKDSKDVVDDFTTYQKGGMMDDPMMQMMEDNKMISDLEKKLDDENEEDEVPLTEEDLEDEVIEDFNLDDLMNIYSTTDVQDNKEAKETSKLISQALNDKSWEKKAEKISSDYDDSFDNKTFDMDLIQVFKKIIIKNQYIFEDDTVKTMRNKLSVSIPLNPKYGNFKLLPEYQYFWINYEMEGKKDKVMVGQKWIRKNELLKVDVEPNTNLKIYENLRDNLLYLRNNFGFKIKREDDENLILRDYENYITNNEIYMIDIFNELGVNYNLEEDKVKNIYDVYVKVYFPLLDYTRFNYIIDALNSKNENENDINRSLTTTILNDTTIESEIYNLVEEIRDDLYDEKGNISPKFKHLSFPNYVIQSNIHVNILDKRNVTGTISDSRFNLFRIFDNFIADETYPFLQYLSFDNQLNYKLYTKASIMNDQDLLEKWFETSPYGLNFKIKISEVKFINISVLETGRIEYKITWKEDELATVDQITESYDIVRKLISKINSENKSIKIIPPDNNRFKYAFINTIQKFELPEKFIIDHNDLSNFSRFFFPYISLVIEPKKRESVKKVEKSDTSKFGTYLRYRRISNYDNRSKMHMRILYYLRNFELSDKELIDEISKQYNITREKSAEELDYVKDKYNKVIKKSKKVLKKLKSMPKSKPPGIGIDIQGKERDRYKIRITGARDKNQLREIVDLIKILLYLYTETYLYKKTKYEKIKQKLKLLNNVAERRNKVYDIMDYENTQSNIKAVTNLDKSRLGYKPEEGQNQWSRNCQNSGTDKQRRPAIINEDQIKELLKMGYKFNKENGFYEKVVTIKIRGKEYKETLRAIKLIGDENKFNYYACDPSTNGKHMYVGFLSRGNNPSNLCVPCCFKKDQLYSDNKKKIAYYKKCIGNEEADRSIEKLATSDLGDKVYILQDTNKIQEGRFIFLPKYLDYFFNKMWDNDQTIKNHYLINSRSGYFFKFTVKDESYHYLSCISNIFDITIDEIKEKMIKFIENDNTEIYFNYLNNGETKEAFKTRREFVNYLKNSNYLEYEIIGELINIPGVITKKGIFTYVLEKKTKIIKKSLDKDVIINRYYLNCLNNENYNYINEERINIIMIKEGKYYFPIYKLKKDGKNDKKIILTKKFDELSIDEKKLFDELINYFNQSCVSNIISKLNDDHIFTAKNIILLLKNKNMQSEIKSQLLDIKNKVIFIKLKNNLLIPVNPSGSSYLFPIEKIEGIDKNILNLTKDNFDTLLKKFKDIESKLNLLFIPKMVYYNKNSLKKDLIEVSSLSFQNNLNIPLKSEKISIKKLDKLKISYQEKALDSEINKLIISYDPAKLSKYSKNRNLDEDLKNEFFFNEGYNLLRLELSNYLSNKTNIRENIKLIVRNENLKKEQKKEQLRHILFEILSIKLVKKYGKGKSSSNLVEIVEKIPDISNYNLKNIRDYCKNNRDKNKCNLNHHCFWSGKDCKLQIKMNHILNYINRIIEEMVVDKIKFKELIQEDNYFVSDIINYNEYTERKDQKIIRTSNFNLKKIMRDLFGKENLPKIGRKNTKKDDINIEEDYPELIEYGNQLIQPIMNNSDSVIRAYVNSLYWINNELYDKESRNLGYFSELQSQITYLLKAQIIDFFDYNKNNPQFKNIFQKFFPESSNFFESALNKFRKSVINSDGKIELIILSYIFEYPIIVFDNYNLVKYIFDKGEKTVPNNLKLNDSKYSNTNKVIKIKFDLENFNIIPYQIYSIYSI